MEVLKKTIDSFHEMLDIFQCPYPDPNHTYTIKDLTDIEWSYSLRRKSYYNFTWKEYNSIREIYYPLRRGTREMYVTNTHVLLAETYTVKYHIMHFYTVLDRSKEIKKEGDNA